MERNTYLACACSFWCHVEVATALPSFASGILSCVTHQIGSILCKGLAYVYPPSNIPTHPLEALGTATFSRTPFESFVCAYTIVVRSSDVLCQVLL